MNFPNLMVGISTKQNTINLIPALQMQVSTFMFVETGFAQKEGWALNAKKVLEFRKVKVLDPLTIPENENSNLAFISKKIIQSLKSKQAVNFNFGGGQKAQSMALWEVFKTRNNPFDVACYADQTNKKIDYWFWEGSNLKQDTVEIESNITILEYFQIHGFTIIEEGKPFSSISKSRSQNEFIEFIEFREYINLCFKKSSINREKTYSIEEIKSFFSPAVKNILKNKVEQKINSFNEFSKILPNGQKIGRIHIDKNQYEGQFYEILLKTIREVILKPDFSQIEEFEVKNPKLIEILGTSKLKVSTSDLGTIICNKIGLYFEEIVFKRISHILSSKTNNVYDVRTNVKIKKGDEEGEYDVVLVTKSGTMIVLDAKTDDFDKKDEDARKHNLLSAAGVYADFIPVYLFFPEDVGHPWANQAILHKLKESSINRKKYLTFNSENENINIEILKQKCSLNPISQLHTILKL
jgi:hypothetical protein